MMTDRINTWRWIFSVVLILYFIYTGADAETSECEHGITLPDGTCDCYSCWKGSSCSEYASRPPKFENSFAKVRLTNDHLNGKPIYKAAAVDPDDEFCIDPEGCPCSTVTYFIASQDGDSNFQIDKHTGEITVAGESYSLYPTYEIRIGANDDGVAYDTMTLTVSTDSSWEDGSLNKYLVDGYQGSDGFMDLTPAEGEQPLQRHKRAVTLPTSVNFDLTKYGNNKDLVDIRVGNRIQFQLNIEFPSGDTDIQVELFAPDSDIIVMMLCKVQVTVGSNLAITGTSVPVLESLDNSNYNDRAIIALGTVTNSGSDTTTMEPSTIQVLYEAVMVDNPATQDQAEYWVSAGAEFNSANDVWVGQASFTAQTTDDSSTFTDPPVVNFTGPSQLAIGSSAVYKMELDMKKPVDDLFFDLFAPVNDSDVMSICGAKVSSVNDAYECGFPDLWDFTPTFTADGNTKGNSRVHFNLGRPVNKYAREYQSTSDDAYKGIIEINVVINIFDDDKLIGNKYWIGATFEIGASIIWAGQIEVTVTPKPVSEVTSPSFNTSIVGTDSISISQPIIIQLDMEVPEQTSADYLLEVNAPYVDDQAIFQICAIKLVAIGENIGCKFADNLETQHTITSNISAYPDIGKLDLGRINNVGSWGWSHANFSETKNRVSIQIVVKATDHPSATVGSTHKVLFGMFVGTSRLNIGEISLTVGTETPAPNITDANTPKWNTSIGGDGSDVIQIGNTAKILLDITTARDNIYKPFNIEFIMPNSSGVPLFKICKIRLESVGANNPCVVKERVEKLAELVSSYGDGVYDRAVIDMPVLCNTEIKDDEQEDRLVLSASVQAQNHPSFAGTTTSVWLSAGVSYSATNLWICQISVDVDGQTAPKSVSVSPHIGYVSNNNDSLTHIPLGYPARYLVRVKLSPNDTSPLTLNISTTDDALSVCSVRFVRAGEAYPCLDADDAQFVVTEEDLAVGVNRKASIDLGYAGNVGSDPFETSNDWDENTIEVEVVTKLTTKTALAPDNSEHLLLVTLFYDPDYTKSTTATVTVTATSDTSIVSAATLSPAGLSGNMSVGSITNDTDMANDNEKLDTIAFGESKRIVVDVDTVFNSTSQLTVVVMTDTDPAKADLTEVQYIGLMDAGENLPCLKHGQTVQTYEPRNTGGPYIDIGTIDLGFVCNVGAESNDTTGTSNRLRVESVVKLLKTDKINPGDTVKIHAAVNSNNQELLVYSVTLTVEDDANYQDIYVDNLTSPGNPGINFNSSESPVVMAIRDTKVFPIVFRVPSFTSSKVWLDADMPVNTSAILTIEKVEITKSGINIPNLEKYEDVYTKKKSSEYNTSQTTKYELHMGIISNAGVSQHTGNYDSDDDTFSAEITLQMADNKIAEDASEHKISFGLHVAKFVYILDMMVRVSRTGSEVLEFNVTSSVDEDNSTNDRVEVDTIFRLTDTANAEGQDSILNIFLPPYVSYISTVVTSPLKSIINMDQSNNAITLSFGPLFFTDEVLLTITIEANGTHLVPLGITGLDSVFKFQPVANTHTQMDVAGEIDYVNFTITTTPAGSPGCTPGDLGLISGTIKDCQISSSADSLAGKEAVNGRYGGTGWSPFVHSGKVSQERYFQVYFGNKVMVNRIKLQQLDTNKATTLKLRYSDDGLSWIENANNVLSPNAGLSDEELDIPSPQISRYIRVMITELGDNSQIATFAFEFVGCQTSTDGPSDPCTAVVTEPTKMSDFARRTFLHTGAEVFVCDGIQASMKIEQRCYSSTDNLIWKEIDSRVGSILGYDSDEPRLYAVAANGLNYMSSEDGLEWVSSVPGDVAKAKALPTYKSSVVVPLDGDSRLNTATPDVAFTDTIYGATSLGLKVNTGTWDTIFKWSTCCP